MIDFDSKARLWDADPRFIERGRHLAEAIAARVPLTTTLRALDYGSGTGHVSFPLQARVGHLTLVDSSAGMLEVAREKIADRRITNMDARQGDLDSALQPDQRFDLIVSAMTLHHMPDTAAALVGFRARLALGGALCIADLDKEDGSFHGPEVDVHHGFDRATLAALTRAAGFDETSFETVFSIEKELADGSVRAYPVFLMTAR